MTQDEQTEGHMQLEAYAAMQQEMGSRHPDLKRLIAAHKVISATGDQAIKEAYALEARMRAMMQIKARVEVET